MQINNKFIRSARRIKQIVAGVVLTLVGLVFVGIGIYSFINKDAAEEPNNTLNFGFIGLGGIVAIVGIIIIVTTIRQAKKTKPLSEEQVLENEKVLNAGKPEIANVTDTKLFFHFGGKMNQSYFVEDKNKEVLFECRLTKFNPIGASTYDFVDVKSGYTQTFKIGKTLTGSAGGSEYSTTTSSRFKIDGVNCWEYLTQRGYEIKHLLQGKQIFRYELVKLGKKVATIVPANIKDPFNEESVNFLRMVRGCYRLEIVDGKLDDIVMAAFIITQTDIVE